MAGEFHYFYRCRKCTAVITRLQYKAALRVGPAVCQCGGGTTSPTNPHGMEWLSLPVLKMVVLQLFGMLEPAPEPTMPLPVPVGLRSVPAVADEEKWVDE
jgi:hypothetical protein